MAPRSASSSPREGSTGRRRALLAALAAGLLGAAALPPFGWWFLAPLGIAVLARNVDGAGGRRRFAVGMAWGFGWLLAGFWWMTEFSQPGLVLACILISVPFGLATLATPASTAFGRTAALVAAVVGLEALRGIWPFGGVPVATLAQTQVGGPVGQLARLGGELAVTAAVTLAGVGLAELARRRWRSAAASLGLVALATIVGLSVAPPPEGRTLSVAAVQAGGERGTRAVDTPAGQVFEAHLDASVDVPRGIDVTLWPEDVVDIDRPLKDTPAAGLLAELAADLDTTLVAGIVERVEDGRRFRNYVAVWGPDGEPGDEYTKNQRVPFGEWIPFRPVVERLADVSVVPRDATVGSGPGILRTDAGNLGVVISFEVFFARRARDAVTSGGEVLLVPTNASSYSTTQMPALEVGAARLRAIETGRWVVQAAPTGFSAVVDPEGRVIGQTDLGSRDVVVTEVDLRSGRTLYTRLGDGPFVAAAAAAMAAGWLVALATGRRRPS